MYSKSKIQKTIEKVISKCFFYDKGLTNKPGEFLEYYCSKELEILKEAKSDDWKDIRSW